MIALVLAAQPTDAELLEACGPEPGWWCENVLDWTGNVWLAKAADWLVHTPLRIGLILLGAWLANRLVRRAIRRLGERLMVVQTGRLAELRSRAPGVLGGPLDPRAGARVQTVTAVLRSLSTLLIYSIAVIMVMGELGISIGPLIAGAGIAGVALGFGAQSLVKDFLSGLFMLLEDQFGVGDAVDLGEVGGLPVAGQVEALTLRTTRLRGLDGTLWHVPNGEIRRVGNKSQQWSRAVLDVVVAYGSDVDTAVAVIKAAEDDLVAEPEWADRVLEPPEVLGVEHLGPEGIQIRVVVKTTPGDHLELLRVMRRRVNAALQAAGVALPLPPGALVLRSDQPPPTTPSDPPSEG